MHNAIVKLNWHGTSKLPLLCLTILAICAFAMRGYYSYLVAPAKENILRTYIGVDAITLVKSGFPDSGRPLPVMGLVYEIQSAYSRIVLNGETHQRAGVGATFIRKGSEPTRFLIEEKLLSKDGLFGPIQYEVLRIVDSQDGSTIAAKEWRCSNDDCDISADDDSKGQYSQAALFVRKVLEPLVDQRNIKYPNIVASAKAVTPSTIRTRDQLKDMVVGCPQSISVPLRRDITRFVVSTGDWSFATRSGIQAVSCLPVGILTKSGQYNVDFDLISYDGRSLGQFSWQGPQGVVLHRTGSTQHLSNAKVSNGMIQIRILYYSDRFPKAGESSVGNMEYYIEFPMPQTR